MLTLSRRPGETIEIGDDIVIHFNRISGNQVSVSIEAPDDVDIWRGELADHACSKIVGTTGKYPLKEP